MNFQDKINYYYDNLDKQNIKENSIIISSKGNEETELELNLPYYDLWPIDCTFFNEINIIKSMDETLYNILIKNIKDIIDLLYNEDTLESIIVGNYRLNISFDDICKNKNIVITKISSLKEEYDDSIIDSLQEQICLKYNHIKLLLNDYKPLNDYIIETKLYKDFIKNTDFDISNFSKSNYICPFSIRNIINYERSKNTNDTKILKVTNYERKEFKNTSIFVDEQQFKTSLNEYTFGLLENVPLSKDVAYSGGSLYDILTNNYDETTINTFIDLDIFCTNKVDKKTVLGTILRNLVQNKHCSYISNIGQVYYIFVEGVPRMIQVIFTNSDSIEEVINNFDSTHVMNFYNGKNVYTKIENVQNLQYGNSVFCGNKVVRLFKILERNLNVVLGDDIKSGIFNKISSYDKNFQLHKITEYFCDTDNEESTIIIGDIKNSSTIDMKQLSEIDYSILEQNIDVLAHKQKQIFNTDIDNLCNLYKFDKNRITCIYKIYNPSILNIVINNIPKNYKPGISCLISTLPTSLKEIKTSKFKRVFYYDCSFVLNGTITNVVSEHYDDGHYINVKLSDTKNLNLIDNFIKHVSKIMNNIKYDTFINNDVLKIKVPKHIIIKDELENCKNIVLRCCMYSYRRQFDTKYIKGNKSTYHLQCFRIKASHILSY